MTLPVSLSPEDAALYERILRRVRVDDAGCWIWQGWRNDKGYGRLAASPRRGAFVHREMARLCLARPIESGEVVMHLCDVPSCCNPDHLAIGTVATNTRDMDLKERRPRRSRMRRLTPRIVLDIRQRLRCGHSVRSVSGALLVPESTVRHIRDGRTWRDVRLADPKGALDYDPHQEAA